jgi:hypothetical protein
LSAEKYINSYCAINGNAVWKNGKKVHENKNTDLPGFLASIYHQFNINYPKFYKMDNLSKLGWLASEVLLQDQLKPATYLPQDTGVVLSNANSSLDTDLKYIASVKGTPSPALFIYTLPNIVVGEICIRNNFKGENAFFISEQFDAGFVAQYVSNLLDNGLKVCICGWVDLLRDEYNAVLFLVTKNKEGQIFPFTQEHINTIFKETSKQ